MPKNNLPFLNGLDSQFAKNAKSIQSKYFSNGPAKSTKVAHAIAKAQANKIPTVKKAGVLTPRKLALDKVDRLPKYTPTPGYSAQTDDPLENIALLNKDRRELYELNKVYKSELDTALEQVNHYKTRCENLEIRCEAMEGDWASEKSLLDQALEAVDILKSANEHAKGQLGVLLENYKKLQKEVEKMSKQSSEVIVIKE
jgi:hypothetical protein